MSDIQDLLERGRSEMTARRAKEAQANSDREQAARAKWEAAWSEVDAKVKAILPEALHPCITAIGERIGDRGDLQDPYGNHVNVSLSVPGCIAIRADVYPNANDGKGNVTYTVPAVDLDTDYDHSGCQIRHILVHWSSNWGSWESDNLPLALALAEERGAKYAELQAELETWQIEQDRERQAQGERRLEKANTANAERAALLRFLENDPVAVHLLRVFAAVQGEREHWQDQVDQVSERFNDFDGRMSDRLQRAEQAAQEAQSRASDADYRARQAEDDLETIKRKARRGF